MRASSTILLVHTHEVILRGAINYDVLSIAIRRYHPFCMFFLHTYLLLPMYEVLIFSHPNRYRHAEVKYRRNRSVYTRRICLDFHSCPACVVTLKHLLSMNTIRSTLIKSKNKNKNNHFHSFRIAQSGSTMLETKPSSVT